MGHEGRIGSCSDAPLACDGRRWRFMDRQRCHVLETMVVDRRNFTVRRLRRRSFYFFAYALAGRLLFHAPSPEKIKEKRRANRPDVMVNIGIG